MTVIMDSPVYRIDRFLNTCKADDQEEERAGIKSMKKRCSVSSTKTPELIGGNEIIPRSVSDIYGRMFIDIDIPPDRRSYYKDRESGIGKHSDNLRHQNLNTAGSRTIMNKADFLFHLYSGYVSAPANLSALAFALYSLNMYSSMAETRFCLSGSFFRYLEAISAALQ